MKQLPWIAVAAGLMLAGPYSAIAASPYYFDSNGTNAGFGDAAGSYLASDAYWSPSPAGTSVPEGWVNARELNFGYVGTPGITSNQFTLDFTGTPGNSAFTGLRINQPATVVFSGSADKNVYATGTQTWTIVSGATLDLNLDWDSTGTVPGGLNHNGSQITVTGGGTINYNTAVLMNGQSGFLNQNDPNLTVNLKAAATWDATVLQGNYLMNAGTLNFATALAANAFAKMDAAKTFTINGGVIDNTSGAPMTLSLNSGSYVIGGNFTFAGSSDLDFGTHRVDLNGGTRTLNVAAKTLSIGGIIANGGIVKEGAGTLELSAANTYRGVTTLNAGTVRLRPDSWSATNSVVTGLKIMPFGDSITYGTVGSGTINYNGYRGYLYNLLSPVLPGFQFVGVKTTIPTYSAAMPSSPLDQTHHMGLGSYTIQVSANNLDGYDNSVFLKYGGAQRDPEGGYWLDGGHGTGRAALDPDIVLMMLGTNDAGAMDGVQARLHALISKLVTLRPNARLIVADIIPRPASAGTTLVSNTIAYNVMVDAEVALFKSQGYHVSGVDLHTGFPTSGLPNTHPNVIGYEWMANKWYAAVVAAATEISLSGGASTSAPPASTSLVTVAEGATLDVNGNHFSIGGLTGAGEVRLGDGLLTVDNLGDETFDGVISGSGELAKSGVGTLTLSGHHSYTGPTTLSQGTLLINGSLAAASSVTVGSAATLGGIGTIQGTVTVRGTLAAGAPAGLLTMSHNLLLESSATLAFGLGTNSEQVAVSGNLTLAGTLHLHDAGGFTPGTNTLFTYTGSLTNLGLTLGTRPDTNLVYEINTDTSGLVQLVVATPFVAWQRLRFGADADNPLIAGPLADPDLDHCANLVEYYAGSNPTNSASKEVLAPSGLLGDCFVIHYQRALHRPDVVGTLEWGTDLATWQESGDSDGTRVVNAVEQVISVPGADPETVAATFQTASGPVTASLFIRLRVDQIE